MRILSNRIFWASLLILAGFLLLINQLFNLDVPVLKILFSTLLIVMGIQVITGPNSRKGSKTSGVHGDDGDTMVFGSGDTILEGKNYTGELNTIFSTRRIYMNQDLMDGEERHLEINTIFSDATLYIPRDLHYKIILNTVFSSSTTPEGSQHFMSEEQVDSGPGESGKGVLHIEANTVFGSFKVRYR